MALSHGNMAFKMHHVMAVIVKRTFLFLLFIGVSEGLKNKAGLGTRRRFRAFDTILHRLEDHFYSRYSIETGQSLMIPLPLLILLDAKTIWIH